MEGGGFKNVLQILLMKLASKPNLNVMSVDCRMLQTKQY